MNGAFKHDPSRRKARANEPKTTRLFESPPPEQFLIQAPDMGYQRAARWLREWKELELEAPDIGYRSRGTVITLCMLKAEIWNLSAGSKRLEILSDRENKLRKELGLTETTRPKVNAGYTPHAGGGGAESVLASLAKARNRA